MKILLIEDDLLLGESLKEFLESEKNDVDWIIDDREYEYKLLSNEYDIILLDLMLKFNKGEELLKKIKKLKNIPIIIITAKFDLSDKETCFLLGADDYITKPFEPKELLLRINAVTRRYFDNKNRIYISDEIVIDITQQSLFINNELIPLTKKEWELLYILAKNRGKIVSNECILNYVWQENPVGTESIRTYIKKLREILGKDLIETHKGRGYRLK
ncbi:response regulator transcription factor [Deferribacter thermophilus]|uniref:response regulator transcription factor n=1 Tax=Deferribacter thermophilus TaxID=53573 RepID=UPI003C25E5EF